MCPLPVGEFLFIHLHIPLLKGHHPTDTVYLSYEELVRKPWIDNPTLSVKMTMKYNEYIWAHICRPPCKRSALFCEAQGLLEIRDTRLPDNTRYLSFVKRHLPSWCNDKCPMKTRRLSRAVTPGPKGAYFGDVPSPIFPVVTGIPRKKEHPKAYLDLVVLETMYLDELSYLTHPRKLTKPWNNFGKIPFT